MSMDLRTRRPRLLPTLLIGGWGGLALGACGGDPETALAPPELQEIQADHVVFDMEQLITTEGVREAKVLADTAFFFQDSSAVHLQGVHMTLYDELGRETAVVTSLRGRLDTRTNQMIGRGDVVLTVHQGNRVVESPELYYDPDTQRIWSDSATVFREGNTVLRGTSFTSDVNFTDARVHNARGRGEAIRF